VPKVRWGVAILSRIEVGHVFRLGTKYSEAMRAVYLDEAEGARAVMDATASGSVGPRRRRSNRTTMTTDRLAISIAPFEVAILPVNMKQADVTTAAERVAADLDARGVEVFLDDREERPGIKFRTQTWRESRAHHARGKERSGRLREIRDRKTGETLGSRWRSGGRGNRAGRKKKSECAP